MTLQVVIDSREQTPLDFGPGVPTVRRKLDAGDYSASGFEHRLAVERKSLSDLLGSLTRDRRRFMEALGRLAALEFRAVVVEAGLDPIVRGRYRSKAHPSSVLGSLVSLQLGSRDRPPVPVVYAGTAEAAALWTLRFLQKGVERCLESAGEAA